MRKYDMHVNKLHVIVGYISDVHVHMVYVGDVSRIIQLTILLYKTYCLAVLF